MRKKHFTIYLVCMILLFGCTMAESKTDEASLLSDIKGGCVSIRAESSVMYINGEPATLPANPFMEENVLFVPYETVAAAFGGTFDYDAETGMITSRFPQIGTMQHPCNVQFSLDSSDIFVEGLKEVSLPLGTDFAGGSLSVYQSCLVNGIIYVPADYFFRFQVAQDWWQAAGSDRTTLSNLTERFGAGPFVLEEDFRNLDKSITQTFISTGEIKYDYGGEKREVWTDGHVNLLLSTHQGDRSDTAIIKEITLNDDFYMTDRGLRIGDSEERLLDLYAGNRFSSVLDVTVLDGLVTQISFQSFW